MANVTLPVYKTKIQAVGSIVFNKNPSCWTSRSTFGLTNASLVSENSRVTLWACGAAGSALPWHGRGRRFDPDQVHHLFNNLRLSPLSVWAQIHNSLARLSLFRLLS
jgi:hypothetical protein